MSPLAEQLTGEIPGLLRRGSPVTCTSDCDGVVALVYTDGAIAVAISDREIESSSPDIYTLDTSDPTGRFHCRLWLAERGHDVGSEDRAEVLAWSVLSVWRGGKPLRGVMLPWEPNGLPTMWMRKCERGADVYLVPGVSCGPDAMKAEADAASLALGLALTNADGSLTLPPLPEVA